ncbi:hypothetical protein EVAR_70752_1 [Eumeta japonica]|uniref:Uncharacterized protein n=1 Tax=Eumeta variegata TaxID=151549 RepID=A0A4C2A3K5_EUMVA|nr:hypothetical protein EVAR_70752_1 [Eumeta japonica]
MTMANFEMDKKKEKFRLEKRNKRHNYEAQAEGLVRRITRIRNTRGYKIHVMELYGAGCSNKPVSSPVTTSHSKFDASAMNLVSMTLHEVKNHFMSLSYATFAFVPVIRSGLLHRLQAEPAHGFCA